MKFRISFFVALLLGLVFSMPAFSDVEYVVKPGDSMWKIGKKLGVPGQMVVRANPNFKIPNLIHPGDKLVIPGVVEITPVEVRPAPIPPPASLPDSRGVEVKDLNNRLNDAERRMADIQAVVAESAKIIASLKEERDALKFKLREYETLLSTSPWHREILPRALPKGWPIYSATLALSILLLALSLLFLKNWRELRTSRAMLGNERREKAEYIAQADQLMNELTQAKQALTTEPVEEVLADRERFRDEKGYPKEKRGEVLHAVLGQYFGDLVEDRKPALRAMLRFFFPRGAGLHRQNGAEAMVPCSGGKFTFGGDGSVDVSLYARPGSPSDPEVNFDRLKSLIESTPSVGERLGIPPLPWVVEGVTPDTNEEVVETVSTASQISQAEKDAAYKGAIARGRDEIKKMGEGASGVPEFRSHVGILT